MIGAWLMLIIMILVIVLTSCNIYGFFFLRPRREIELADFRKQELISLDKISKIFTDNYNDGYEKLYNDLLISFNMLKESTIKIFSDNDIKNESLQYQLEFKTSLIATLKRGENKLTQELISTQVLNERLMVEIRKAKKRIVDHIAERDNDLKQLEIEKYDEILQFEKDFVEAWDKGWEQSLTDFSNKK